MNMSLPVVCLRDGPGRAEKMSHHRFFFQRREDVNRMAMVKAFAASRTVWALGHTVAIGLERRTQPTDDCVMIGLLSDMASLELERVAFHGLKLSLLFKSKSPSETRDPRDSRAPVQTILYCARKVPVRGALGGVILMHREMLSGPEQCHHICCENSGKSPLRTRRLAARSAMRCEERRLEWQLWASQERGKRVAQ